MNSIIICECPNFSCHPHTGACVCHPGWDTPQCDLPCAAPFWGPGCDNLCNCSTIGAACDSVTGQCMCPPGHTGAK